MENQSVLAVREALWLALHLAGLPLLAMLAVGLVVSVFQALAQVQESTLAFLPKLVVLGLVVVVLGPGMAGTMRGYAASLFDRMIAVGGQP